MDAVEFLKEHKRLCDSNSSDNIKTCADCLIYNYCTSAEMHDSPETAVQIVEEWSELHPKKTRQDEFLKLFPNALMEDKVISICPLKADEKLKYQCVGCTDCDECKKKYWLSEVEE